MFKRNCQTIFQSAVPLNVLPETCGSSSYSTSSPQLAFKKNFSHYRFRMSFPHYFSFHFPSDYWCWIVFMLFSIGVLLSLVKCLFKPFPNSSAKLGCCFFTVEFWKFIIYSEHKSFVRYVICKYFLPVCAWLFTLLTVLLAEQKFLILLESNLSFFSFMDYALGDTSKSLCITRSWRFSPVSTQKLWCLTHLGLIFI